MRRKAQKMTQEDLAQKIQVSKSAIAKWERNGGIPDRDNLKKLAEVLGTSVGELYSIVEGHPGSGEINITEDIIRLLESYGYTVTKNKEG